MTSPECKHDFEHISDQWGNVRCSNCKQIIPAEMSLVTVEEGAAESDNSSKADQAIAPKYQEYLKATAKFQARRRPKKKRWLDMGIPDLHLLVGGLDYLFPNFHQVMILM